MYLKLLLPLIVFLFLFFLCIFYYVHSFFRFSDKTKNAWSQRNKFVKVAGKYDMVALDYSADVSVICFLCDTQLGIPLQLLKDDFLLSKDYKMSKWNFRAVCSLPDSCVFWDYSFHSFIHSRFSFPNSICSLWLVFFITECF